MKCKKLVIETDGTTDNTKVLIDGEQLPHVQRLEVLGNVEDRFVNVLIEQAKVDGSGTIMTKKTNVRDKDTQKFVEGTKVITEALSLEFER